MPPRTIDEQSKEKAYWLFDRETYMKGIDQSYYYEAEGNDNGE